jgi:hypothetical protein
MNLTRQEGAALIAKKPKRSKYGNTKIVIDGIAFDSKAEGEYYRKLKIREKAGEVSGVEMQRSFALIGPSGLLIATYRCDFAFIDHSEDCRFRVIDVKGFETSVFKLKRKMMKALLGITVETVW